MTMFDAATVAANAAALPPLPDQPPGTPWPTDNWPVAPSSDAVDQSALNALLDQAFDDPQPEATMGLSLAAVVVHRGQIIAERYGPQIDTTTTLTSWSMAKAMTQAAIGLLVHDGVMNIDDRAPVPEWSDPNDARHNITIRQLLHMSSGLEFNEDYIDGDTSHCLEMLFGSGQHDMGAYAAEQAQIADAGTVFNYSSGTTNILARIVASIVGTGDSYAAWLDQRLFAPLGMTSAEPKFDESGTFVGSSYVYATARDFARFGLLYLRDGVWDGTRLLPEGWVDFARTPVAVDDEHNQYGAQWWVPYPERGVFAAQGYETQRILVLPDADAIIVRLGKTVIDLAPNVVEWQGQLVDCFAPATPLQE